MSAPIQNPYARKAPPATAGPPRSTTNSTAQAVVAPFASAPADPTTGSTTTAAAPFSDRDNHVVLQQSHVLYVSHKQQGNGVLDCIKNVPIAYARMVPDFLWNSTQCALFLSCQYHALHPDYIHRRMAELKSSFTLRVLLVLVDVQDNANLLLTLNLLAVTNNWTLILAWSDQEAARYLETFKALSGRDAKLIQKKESTHLVDQVAGVVSSIPGVNGADAAPLLGHFGSWKAVAEATPDELSLVPQWGAVKVKRFHEAMHMSFQKKV